MHDGIDDSTGIVTSCFLEKEETTHGYQMILKDTILNYGIPECLYTDYRTVFQSNKKELTLDEELAGKEIKNTRFANMLNHLGVNIISTVDPRSKGRIERLWRTFQDRLYKELKKKNINTIEKANQYIKDVFLPRYNTRFASEIDYNKNLFIKVDENFDFNKELAIWSEHSIFHNCYLKFNKTYYLIMKDDEKISLSTKLKVKVYTFLDGSQHLLFNDIWYNLKPIKNTDIVIHKQENISLTSHQTRSEACLKNSLNSPWRKWNPNKLF